MRPSGAPRSATAGAPVSCAPAGGAPVAAGDADPLAALEARLAAAALTPGEIAEAVCIALGVDPRLSAAARGVSERTVRERRRRVRRKLERVLCE